MLTLRADPWAPEYGMGFEARVDEPQPAVDPSVEGIDWSRPRRPDPGLPAQVWFVDGVRRVELRLWADDGGRRAPGLFGSYATGSVCCDARASFQDHVVRRAVVVGGGLQPPQVEVAVGRHLATYEPASDPSTEPDRPLWKLQQLMQQEEGNLAARTAAIPDRVVLVDGPLTFADPTGSPVVGVVKRFARHYLEPDHERLLAQLGPGERTPLFGLGTPDQPLRRYAWYTRLVPLQAPWHDHAGIVRGEVWGLAGLERAIGLADQVSSLLPRFAGRPTDPRAPQNLAPVGGLETWLRHRMGDARMLRRALLDQMSAAPG